MGWVVDATSAGNDPGTPCIGGRVSPKACLDGCGKSRLTGIQSPDRPARSESQAYVSSTVNEASLNVNYNFLISCLSHLQFSEFFCVCIMQLMSRR